MQPGLFSVSQTAHMCVILLGWSRPEQSGHEARRRRRKQGRLAQVIGVSLLYDDDKGQSLTSSKFLPEDKCSELKPLPLMSRSTPNKNSSVESLWTRVSRERLHGGLY